MDIQSIYLQFLVHYNIFEIKNKNSFYLIFIFYGFYFLRMVATNKCLEDLRAV